jgi:hypothetical protein
VQSHGTRGDTCELARMGEDVTDLEKGDIAIALVLLRLSMGPRTRHTERTHCERPDLDLLPAHGEFESHLVRCVFGSISCCMLLAPCPCRAGTATIALLSSPRNSKRGGRNVVFGVPRSALRVLATGATQARDQRERNEMAKSGRRSVQWREIKHALLRRDEGKAARCERRGGCDC